MPSSAPPPPSQPNGPREYVSRRRARQPIIYVNQKTPAQKAAAAREAAHEAEITAEKWLLKSRRAKVGAVAAIIVVIGATISGAQIKEIVKSWRLRREIQDTADRLALEESIIEEAGETSSPARKLEAPANAPPPVSASPMDSMQHDRDILRQIAALDYRRGLLYREKEKMQTKLRRFEEKQANEARIEAQRTGTGLDR